MPTDPKVKPRGPRRRMRYVATPAEWDLIRELKLTGCRLCGRGPYLCSLHHIVPRSLGGDDVADNLVCLCGDGTRGCHGLAEAREGETLAALADALTPPERAYARSKLGPFALERLYGLPSRNHQRPLERGRNPRKPERPGGVVDTGHTPGSEGWYGPPQSRRYHYFGADGRSLCGKWFVFAWSAELIDKALGPADGDCAACKRKLQSRVSGEVER